MTATTSKQAPSTYMLIGFGIWLAATIVVRLMGQQLFVPGNLLTLLVFAIGAVGMFFFIRWLLGRLRVPPAQRTSATAWLLLPALFLDSLSLIFAGVILPNLSKEAVPLFGGWLLVLYGATFLSVLVSRDS